MTKEEFLATNSPFTTPNLHTEVNIFQISPAGERSINFINDTVTGVRIIFNRIMPWAPSIVGEFSGNLI